MVTTEGQLLVATGNFFTQIMIWSPFESNQIQFCLEGR